MDSRNNQELAAFIKQVNEIGLTESVHYLKDVFEKFKYKEGDAINYLLEKQYEEAKKNPHKNMLNT